MSSLLMPPTTCQVVAQSISLNREAQQVQASPKQNLAGSETQGRRPMPRLGPHEPRCHFRSSFIGSALTI
jgi:hypothetical protein